MTITKIITKKQRYIKITIGKLKLIYCTCGKSKKTISIEYSYGW